MVVIPVFNEEACIPALFARLATLRLALADTADVRVLFVDDGSRDRSFELLASLARIHAFVTVVGFSRNFGHQIAVTAGLDLVDADWAAILDADLQDPPEELIAMLASARKGVDVVYAQRRKRSGETLFKRASAAAFYKLLKAMADVSIPEDTGDFRLMSRRVVEQLRNMRERHRFIRGMIPWLGFASVAHPYDRDPRYAGETKYPLRKMLRFAAVAVTSFSAKPLAFATRFGLLAAAAGAVGAIYMLFLKAFTNIPVPGVTSVLVAIAFFSGVQIMLIGLIGEYLAKVFEEVKGRPLYVIDRAVNIEAMHPPTPPASP